MRIQRARDEHVGRRGEVDDFAQIRIEHAAFVRRPRGDGAGEGHARLAGVRRAEGHEEVVEHQPLDAAIRIAEHEAIRGRDAERVGRRHRFADALFAELAQTEDARAQALLDQPRIQLERVAARHPHHADARALRQGPAHQAGTA